MLKRCQLDSRQRMVVQERVDKMAGKAYRTMVLAMRKLDY